MKLKIKKLHKDAIIPKYMTKDASCFDVSAYKDVVIHPYKTTGNIYSVSTGLVFEIPKGYEINVRARSGLSLKYPNYIVMTGGGSIDSDYRGPVNICIINHTNKYWVIKKGDRIAQCKINKAEQCEFEEVEELSKTERGECGFGSTGK